MKNKTPEFKKGQIVTFSPYEQQIKARVIEVCLPQHNSHFVDRVSYRLEGAGKQTLTSHCTGNSIKESAFYQTNY